MAIEVLITAVLCLLCGGLIGYIARDKCIAKKQVPIKEFDIKSLETFKPKMTYWTVSYKRSGAVLGEMCTITAPTKRLAIEEAYKNLTSEVGNNRFALTNIQEFVCKEDNNDTEV
ncbi:hypothetical protein [Enterococcus sp. AZ163]|uniref:hypothetical protein n=1 Tax=Enterococcus sp. AZ163 TaxID=2774638 RepID=UPI003D2DE414